MIAVVTDNDLVVVEKKYGNYMMKGVENKFGIITPQMKFRSTE